MGKRTARFLCGFRTFLLLLYSVEVLSGPTMQTIMDVIKRDKSCEEMPLFLLESDITKDCAKLEYPQSDLQLDYTTINNFVCLGVYDTMYKICQYSSHGQKPFYNSSTFFTDIQKYFPDKTGNQTKFCEHVKGITPMYKKTEPFVTKLTKSLDDTFNCHSMCFTFKGEFKPLCAILAWIKNIDEQFKKSNTIQNTGKAATGDVMQANEQMQQEKSPVNEGSEKKMTTKNSNINVSEIPKSGSLNTKAEDTADKKNTLLKKEPILVKPLKSVQESETQDFNGRDKLPIPNTGNKHSKEQINKNNDILLVANLQKNANDPPIGVEDIHIAKDDKTTILTAHSDNNGEKSRKEEHSKALHEETEQTEKGKITVENIKEITGNEETAKPSNEEINESGRGGVQQTEKELNVITSTISQHTQDHEEQNNQVDYNHLDDQLPYGPVDTDSMDTGDQNPNMPEPSEQRETIPRYHNMRPDEESHFFTYFTVIFLVCIAAYVGYHNKQKILAIVLEGRRSRNNRNRRRPSTASYRKLDCTLEEAVTSQCNANVTHVIY